jgi:coenzyme F420-dependent glucose-6-phosphate dehydrogenase
MLKLGYKASSEQFSATDLLGYSVIAEECGFDSVVLSDHFQPWRHSGGHAPFCFGMMSAVAVRTERVEIGTSVVTPTFRYHPAIVAQAVATVAQLAPGRVWLGVGTGEAMNEKPLGVTWPETSERFARLKEAVEVIQRLWSEERVTYQGIYYSLEVATIYEKPSIAIPLLVAASGPAAAKLAGRRANGFICTSGKGVELYTDTLLPAVRSGAEQAGRDFDQLELAIEMKVSFDRDLKRAMEETRHWAALALTPEEKTDVEDPVEMERRADALSAERAASRWIVSTDVDEHVERVLEYVKMGFTHLIFHSPDADQARFLRLYGDEVLPALRAKGGRLLRAASDQGAQ